MCGRHAVERGVGVGEQTLPPYRMGVKKTNAPQQTGGGEGRNPNLFLGARAHIVQSAIGFFSGVAKRPRGEGRPPCGFCEKRGCVSWRIWVCVCAQGECARVRAAAHALSRRRRRISEGFRGGLRALSRTHKHALQGSAAKTGREQSVCVCVGVGCESC